MAAGALVVVLVLLVGIGGGLYLLVRAEHDDREAMERTSAERAARRDTSERDDR